MPGLTPQSSDVRFSEKDLSSIIRSRSASVGALVFVSSKGRLGRFTVSDSAAFKKEYGIPNASISFGHYAALAALEEMSTLVCARAMGSGYSWSGCVLKVLNEAPTIPLLTGDAVFTDSADSVVWADYEGVSHSAFLLFYPKSGPGSYGDDLGIRIRSANLTPPAAPTLTLSTLVGDLPQGTYSYKVTALSEVNGTLVETQASAATSTTIGVGLNGQITVVWAAKLGAKGYKIYGRNGTTYELLATVGATTVSWTDTGVVTPNPSFVPPVTAPATTPVFVVDVYDTSTNTLLESWDTTLFDYTDGNGVQLEATQHINAFSDYVSVFSPGQNPDARLFDSTAITNLFGGDSGTAPTNSDISTAWTTYFADPEQVQVNILINGGYTDTGVQTTMLNVAEARGDATAILDIPSVSQNADDAIKFRQLELNANTSYGAIYTSDVMINDNDNGKRLYTPQSGKAAAVYARTDRLVGPQGQPAGLNRGGVDAVKVRVEYSEPERTRLYNAQVNYIRNFRGIGLNIFEAVTLQSNQSALSWVSVRRMLNVIKPSVRDFLIYSLHEPNDDFTRRQIVSSVSDYLEYWKNARGILDYSVISDESNNPAAKYNLGILTVTLLITPIIPIHEIQVDMAITKQGMSWSEINISNLG